ncbi:MAG: hypothetical protein WAM91_05015 [Candidatus Acidiferrales bacterium]
MRMLYFKKTIIWACLFAFLLPIAGKAKTMEDINTQLLKAIAKVRKAKTPAARYKEAERLGAITYEKDCSGVNDKTIQALISLLDIEDDGVRMWVASDLGDIGPRAKAAAPKLISILSVSNCMTWDHSSASTIPIALKRMGVDPPARNCNP